MKHTTTSATIVPPTRAPAPPAGVLAASLLAACLVAACSHRDAAPAGSAGDAPPRPALGAPEVLSDASTASATVMMAMSASGERAWVWSASPPGDGTLMVRTDAVATHAIPDKDGPTGMDPETPAKVAYGPAGELYVAYSAMKQLPLEHDDLAPDWRAGQRTSFRLIRSEDSGKTWSAPVNIADDGAWGAYRSDHALHVAADGTLYASWLDGRDPKKSLVRVARSGDKGKTWTASVAVDPQEPCDCCRMSLASSGDGRVYVAWRKVLPGSIRDIVVAGSADRGQTWGAPVLVHADNWQVDGCPDAGPAMLAEAGGRLHAVWWTGKEGAAGVQYAGSADGGKSWAAALPLKMGAASRASHAQVARGPDGALYVAWDDGLSAEPQILLAVSRTDGASFQSPVVVSAAGASAGYPSIAAGKRGYAIAWHQPDPANEALHQVVTRSALIP